MHRYTHLLGLRVGVTVLALSAASSALPGTSANPKILKLAQAQRDVIVILRDQLANVPAQRGAMEPRASAIAAAQLGVLATLQQSGPHKIRSFATINAFATKVSPLEAATLANHPDVQAVVPDAIIRGRPHAQASSAGSAGESISTKSVAGDNGLCGTLEPQALELTHTAYADTSKPQAQEVIDGNGHKVTGMGVKVAYIADGVDPNLKGFIRPDGSHVFVDYQDFSGDPAGTPTAGGEAFGDASSIAAQDMPNGKVLTFDISKFVNAAHPLPSPCNIRIRGMAPGASLVGLKVLSNFGYTTNSTFVQAIEWAVVHDKVDVLNESFGGNPFPDNSNDPISLANDAAIRAGVVVVVSTGDGGPTGTVGSPATSSDVISSGATTQFRLYAQTGYGDQVLAKGVVSDNISGFSSAGFAQATARIVDTVAPGDLGWALCSTNTALYTDCTDFNVPANSTPIEDFGGTSESSPLTAGAAALVIQAYRSTHGGANPTPALVKRILMSTATDLGAPSFEQGAGLINSYAAVNAALSVQDGNGSPKAHGEGFLANPSSAIAESAPNTHETRSFKITNTGTTTQHLTPTLQTLDPPMAGQTMSVNLDPSTDPAFINPNGAPRTYVKRTFTVPAGAQHLDAAIAWQVNLPDALSNTATPIAYLGLLDPHGRQAAYSIPQGLASAYGHVDIVHPAAGTWTAVIWTRPAGAAGSYAGPVQFTWAAERYVELGTVHPSTLDLPPGQSASITADFMMPSNPGDLSAAIRFSDSKGEHDNSKGEDEPEIPLSLRTLIPVGPTGGSFTGTLTGGNGRAGVGPYQTYEFDVPWGVATMNLNLEIADNGYLLEGVLVDPNGMQLSVQPNVDAFGNPQFGMSTYHYNPQPGRWRFTLVQDYYSSGNQTSLPFTARIGFNFPQVALSGLPNDANTVLSASGSPVNVQVNVTNTGAVTAAYFADARLRTLGLATLPQQACAAAATLPGTCGLFYVPTEVSTLLFLAESTAPLNMDAYNDVGYIVGGTGNPDIFAAPAAPNTVLASLSVPEVPWGAWVEIPSLVGPYGPGGAPTTPVTMAAAALMQPFDAAVSASSGDIWADLTLGTSTFNPLVLAPGASGTITVTIAPDSTKVGDVVKGYLYIDTFNPTVNTGDEVVRIPYRYTVGQ
jgi:hypothetical protein